MYNWFECKVKYDKMMETGITRTVTESFLVDALSFTEAEARIVEEVKPFISGEFSVSDIRKKKFSDTFLSATGDRYYNARLSFISLDEKSGAEKETKVNMLVGASELLEALSIVEREMGKTMVDYRFLGVTETSIMDVFPYKNDGNE